MKHAPLVLLALLATSCAAIDSTETPSPAEAGPSAPVEKAEQDPDIPHPVFRIGLHREMDMGPGTPLPDGTFWKLVGVVLSHDEIVVREDGTAKRVMRRKAYFQGNSRAYTIGDHLPGSFYRIVRIEISRSEGFIEVH